MKSPDNNERSTDELAWLAFCYLNDELATAETQAFEARLADDPAASTALARMVQEQTLIRCAIRPAGALSDVITPLRSSDQVSVQPSAKQTGERSSYHADTHSGGKPGRFSASMIAAITAMVVCGVGLWGLTYYLASSEHPTRLAQTDPAWPDDTEVLLAPLNEYFNSENFSDEELASRLAEMLTQSTGDEEWELDESDFSNDAPIRLQSDWMLEVFTEFGEDLDDLHDGIDELDPRVTRAERSIG